MDLEEQKRTMETLSEAEKEVLFICAKSTMSIHKNFTTQTIQKKLPRPFKDERAKKLLKFLRKKKLVRLYRAPDNWAMTKDGLNISHYILKKRQEALALKILKHGIVL